MKMCFYSKPAFRLASCLLGLILSVPAASSAAWSKLSVDPRAAAAGGIAPVFPADAWTALENPALLGPIQQHVVSGVMALPSADSSAGRYTWGASYVEPDSGFGAGELTFLTGRRLLTFDSASKSYLYENRTTWLYGIGKQLNPNFSLGGNLRLESVRHQETSGTEAATLYRFDVGAAVSSGKLRLSGALLDLVGSTKQWQDGATDAPIPTVRLSAGVAVRPDLNIGGAYEVAGSQTGWALGANWQRNALALRAGFSQEPGETSAHLGAGVGWSMPATGGSMAVDASYVDRDAGTGRIGITWMF
ncbi:MAG TPA: hypothetical protein VFK80_00815 [Limnochordia bacterium]|nr:hypothetical protein [Limnochordia bacterium]